MGMYETCMGIVLLLTFYAITGRGTSLIRYLPAAIVYVAKAYVYVATLYLLLFLGLPSAVKVGETVEMLLGGYGGVAGCLFFVLLIVAIVYASRYCHPAGKAPTFAPSAHARKESDVALRPQIDAEVEKLISAIAQDRAFLAMSELKKDLRRVSPDLSVPKTEGHKEVAK